jgi:uncharacterized protein with LGFP repeats
MKWMQRNMAALVVAVALSVGLVGPAAAQQQSGLVNLNVGNVTLLQDVNIGVAIQAAAAICGLQIGPVAVLAAGVVSGGSATICTLTNGPVTITQL